MNRHRHVALAGVLLLCGAGAGPLLRAAGEGNDADKRAKLELQDAQPQFDLAESNLRLTESCYKSATAANQKLQWQPQTLNDEVARLKEQISRIAPQARVYPWRY